MCRSIRLPSQQRPKNTEDKPVFGRATTPGSPEAKSLRRDDGPGQAVTRVVDASNDVITLSADWPTCSSHEPHQATALRRSRTEASARQVDYAKRDCLFEASYRSLAWEKNNHTSVVTTGPPEQPGIPARNGFNGFLRALPGDRAFLSPSSVFLGTDLTPRSRRQDHTT